MNSEANGRVGPQSPNDPDDDGSPEDTISRDSLKGDGDGKEMPAVSKVNNNYKATKEAEANGSSPVAVLPSDPEKTGQKKGTRKFFDGVLADLMNRDLLPLKVLFFFKYATLFVLYPFMPLHLKSLGLTATEAGINSGIIPVFVILAPPFSGVIADKIGNFKIFLTGLTLLNAPLALALLLVPTAREVVTLPAMMTYSFSCDPMTSQLSSLQHPFILQTLDSSICQISSPNGSWELDPSTSGSLQCGTICTDGSPTTELPVFGLKNVSSDSYSLPDGKSTFTPFKRQKPQFKCTPTSGCTFDLVDVSNPTFDPKELHIPLGIQYLKLLDVPMPPGNITEPKFGIGIQGLRIGDVKLGANQTSQCGAQIESKNSTCRNACVVQLKRSLVCSNQKEQKVYNVYLTFGLYTLLRILLGVASATSFIMFEGAVLAILKEFGGDYGLQRVAATLAAIIFAPLSGYLIQLFHNFYPAFYLYAILQCVSGFITLKIDLRFKRPTEKILGHLKEVLTQVEILIFFAAMLLSGTSWGYLESFLFWFLEDLKASNFLMGLTISVGGLFGIPVLILSRPIIKRFGHVNILCVGLLFYSIRLIGYSFIENPWLCLPFEAMEAITASLAITAAATYAAALSSAQTIASIQGIWGGLYFGFGRGAGSLLGGYLMRGYGARDTFRIFSLMSLLGAILYFIVNMSYIERYSKFQRKTSGLNLNDIRGDKHKRALEEQKGRDDADTLDIGGGCVGPCDVNFTDIPLDEETPPVKSKSSHPSNNVTNRKGDKNPVANSSL